jgi:hypothetical protein
MASIHHLNAVSTPVASPASPIWPMMLLPESRPAEAAVSDAAPGTARQASTTMPREALAAAGGMSPSVVEPTDGHVVGMAGAVTPGVVIALYRTIAAAMDAGRRLTVIDLSAVTFLGVQTAGLFCGALRLLERRGAVLEILSGPQPLPRMLVADGSTSRVTQRAERDQQRSREAIAAFGDHPARVRRTRPRGQAGQAAGQGTRPTAGRNGQEQSQAGDGLAAAIRR